MARWADYLISEVTYDPKHRIRYATRHKDTEEGIMGPEVADRDAIVDDLKDGVSYCTIISGLDKWVLGEKVRFHYVRGHKVIRIDNNKVTFDHLGQIPEVSNPPEEAAEEKTEKKPIPEKKAPPKKPAPPKEAPAKSAKQQVKKGAPDKSIEAKIQELASVKKELDELDANASGGKPKKAGAASKSKSKK